MWLHASECVLWTVTRGQWLVSDSRLRPSTSATASQVSETLNTHGCFRDSQAACGKRNRNHNNSSSSSLISQEGTQDSCWPLTRCNGNYHKQMVNKIILTLNWHQSHKVLNISSFIIPAVGMCYFFSECLWLCRSTLSLNFDLHVKYGKEQFSLTNFVPSIDPLWDHPQALLGVPELRDMISPVCPGVCSQNTSQEGLIIWACPPL